MSSHEELRRIALAEFATAGYSGTSLQRIAELAGLSKSSVLYHYDSKEALLDAAIGPAIDRLDAIVTRLQTRQPTGEVPQDFLHEFVEFLLEHRLEVNTFVNQAATLGDVPAVARAQALVRRIVEFLQASVPSIEGRMRFGIALGGAAYMLCSVAALEAEQPTDKEMRPALETILGELFAPVRLT